MPTEKNFKRQVRQRMVDTGERYTTARSQLELPAASDPAIDWLLSSSEPAIRYRTLVEVLGRPESDTHVRAARAAIPDGPKVRAILAAQRDDFGWGARHHGHKYTGTVHVLSLLSAFRVPGDHPRIQPVLGSLVLPKAAHDVKVIDGRPREHMGRFGAMLDMFCRFGLVNDPRAAALVDFILWAQWPDGGWNCDKKPSAHNSSFMETVGVTKGLFHYHALTGDERAWDAAVASTDIFVKRGIIRSQRSGNLISGRMTQLHWPRGYDFLVALDAIAPAGLGDPRLSEALDLLESKRGKDSAWRANGPTPPVTREGPGEVVDLSDGTRDQMVTLRALRVLRAAGRTAVRSKAPSRRIRRNSKETLEGLLLDCGSDAAVESMTPLVIDDDGTYFRTVLEDGTTRLYREFATTSSMSNKYMALEAMRSDALRAAGLPVPEILGQSSGSAAAGGDPAAMLMEDAGGDPLALYLGHRKVTDDDLFMAVTGTKRDAMWAVVGEMLGCVHGLDVAATGIVATLGSPEGYNQRLAKLLSAFTNVLTRVGAAYPGAKPAVDELVGLRPALRDYMAARPLTVRTGDYFLPAMLLEHDGKRWHCPAWVGWGYYAAVGDPMRDVAAIERRHREWTGEDVPDAFYRAYGRPVDPIVLLFCRTARQCAALTQVWGPRHHARGYVPTHPEIIDPVEVLPAVVDQLKALVL